MSMPSSPIGLLPAFTPQSELSKQKNDEFRIFQDADNSGSPMMKQKKQSTANIAVLEDSNRYYPTPVATSAGPMPTSSSPIKETSDSRTLLYSAHEDDAEVDDSKENLFEVGNSKLQPEVRKPLNNVAIMKLSRSGRFTSVGRSSRSSDVALDSKNKHVSRVHAKAKFDAEKLSLTVDCLGWNGLVVCVPQKDKDQEVGYRINKSQSVTLPFKEGIYLDLRGERVMITVDEAGEREEEETDDEIPICMTELQKKEADTEAHRADNKAEDNARNSAQNRVQNVPDASPTSPALDLVKQHSLTKRAPSAESLADTKKRTKTTSPAATPTAAPRSKVSENQDEQQASKESKESNEPPTEEPPYNEEDVINIISNYLAFSRLQSVPLSTIWKSNSVLTKLKESTFRSVLKSIQCVGVIQRIGKDASGKPLEEEYYYIPEKDTNLDRRHVVEQSRGHIGLRSCRKSHKQYFWKKPAK